MGSVTLIAAAIIVGIGAAVLVVSHASIVGSSFETAAIDVSEKIEELKCAISRDFDRLLNERGAK